MAIKFGEILESILNSLNIKQIELTNKYNIPKGTVSGEREMPMSRLRMRKYKPFLSDYGINEEYFLQGEGEMFAKATKDEPSDVVIADDLEKLSIIERYKAAKQKLDIAQTELYQAYQLMSILEWQYPVETLTIKNTPKIKELFKPNFVVGNQDLSHEEIED